jgi:hypothetical protein
MRWLYWGLLLGTLIVVPQLLANAPRPPDITAFWYWLRIEVVLGLPLVQLVVSGLALFSLPMIAEDQRDAAHRRLGRITWWTVQGTLIGIGVMIPVGGLLLLTCR